MVPELAEVERRASSLSAALFAWRRGGGNRATFYTLRQAQGPESTSYMSFGKLRDQILHLYARLDDNSLKRTFYYLHTEMNELRAICVYCGSATGVDPTYAWDAVALAEIFIQNKIRLVNGGGSIGLMGVMADAMIRGGGEATGVIPLSLKEKEVAHLGMTELIVVPDMHSRKLMMVNMSDAFIALPGGFGTLDEVFETLTWAQLHLHKKPVIVYNPNGFYDLLLAQADHMLSEGFLNQASRALLMSTPDIHRILPMLVSFQPPTAEKWSNTRR